MPEISRFYGIVIKMFHNELRRVWEQARNQEPLDQIDPLP
jgi:hypothetical protein